MLYEIIGWCGTFLILIAYYLVQVKKVSADNKIYDILNIVGALGIIVNAFVHRAFPSVGLNVAWVLIAVYSIIKVVKR